tara:strand:+ start:1931 stop:2107 length:177 start_codon:yes stop_codon:yes gene_type:complete
MEEFDELKPIKNRNDFNRWNLVDLEQYILNLKKEIIKVSNVIEKKKQTSNAASNLFKN